MKNGKDALHRKEGLLLRGNYNRHDWFHLHVRLYDLQACGEGNDHVMDDVGEGVRVPDFTPPQQLASRP